jgi:hypothetical protein
MSEPAAIEAAERRAVAAATAAVAVLVAEQVAARAARDALFLAAYRARSLPFMMAASAVVALVSAELLSSALARRSPSRVVPAGAVVSAACLLALWPVASVAPRVAAVLVYLHVAAFGAALVSGFWSLVNERFDPYTARRVVGRIGTGATAGGVAGGAIGWGAALLLPVPAILLALALLHATAALVLLRLRTGAGSSAAAGTPNASFAFQTLARTPYLQRIAVVVGLGAIVEGIVDWAFKAEVQKQFAGLGGGGLLAPLSLFYTAMAVASLLLQSTLARAALERLGIAGTVAVRPVLTAVGSLFGTLGPGLGTATAARGAHEALTNSLFRSGYELLYTPVPDADKRRSKAVIDLALDKGGALVASGLILAVLALAPLQAERALFAIAACLSLGAVALSRGLHRGYVRALERSLVAGQVRLDPRDVVDRATQRTLAHTSTLERSRLLAEIERHRSRQGLEGPACAVDPTAPPTPPLEAASSAPQLEALRRLLSGERDAIRDVLAAHPDPPPVLVGALVPLLARSDSYAGVLQALRRAAPRVTGQLVDAMLDPANELVVRRRLARVLKACATPRAAEGLLAALDDPSFELRAAAAAALASLHEQSAVVQAGRERVLAQVRRELDSGEPVDRQLPHVVALLSLVLERQPLQIAWAAMKGGDRALRGTALEYLSNVLPDDVFPRLRSLFGASAVAFAARERPVEQVTDELRHSAVGLRIGRPPWQEGDTDQSAGS